MPGIKTRVGVPLFGGRSLPSNWTQLTLSVLTYSSTRIDLLLNGRNPMSIERSTDGVNYTEIATVVKLTPLYSDVTFTAPAVIYYRYREHVGSTYGVYSPVATAYPAGVRVNSANTTPLLADASNAFYFSNGTDTDYPFSVLAIAKSNDLTIGNILLSRGDANGVSYMLSLNQADKGVDMVIYGSDLTGNNILYLKTATNLIDAGVNRLAYTYNANKLATGMNIYVNGVKPTYTNQTKYGTYTKMNNRAGMYVGRQLALSYQGNLDCELLLIVNKELNQTEITEFQNMADKSGVSSLSFYANIISINKFAGTLTDDRGNHNGSATTPVYFNTYQKTKPTITKITYQDTFEHFKLGWFICYGMETYTGNEFTWEAQQGIDAPAPATFNQATVDVHTWATLAASYGKLDYAILTAWHITGFSLFDHKTALWGGTTTTLAAKSLPAYLKYDVGQTSSDKNILSKFITEFNAVNIKPILYVNIAANTNYYVNDTPSALYADPNFQFAANHKFLRDRIKEIATLNPFAIWIDGCLFYPTDYLKDIYNDIKAINPAIGVRMNLWTNHNKVDNPYFPFDGATTEEGGRSSILSSDTWWGLTQKYDGVTYPCVKELTFTSRASAAWYWKPTPYALRNISELQTLYDYSKAAGIPCAVSMNPKNDGIMDQAQADLIGSIVL